MRERLTDDGFEVFEPTADGILRWVETTRPTPRREDVIAHVRALAAEGVLSDADLRRLAEGGYPAAGSSA